MGQQADSMIEGEVCSWCMMPFIGDGGDIYTHGYPVVCKPCAQGVDKEDLEDIGLQRTDKETL